MRRFLSENSDKSSHTTEKKLFVILQEVYLGDQKL